MQGTYENINELCTGKIVSGERSRGMVSDCPDSDIQILEMTLYRTVPKSVKSRKGFYRPHMKRI